MADPIFSGVAYTPPPPHLMEDALRIVNDGVATLKPGSHGAIIGVATKDPITGRWSTNGAIVQRIEINDRIEFAVVGWVGKKWGERLSAGGGAKVEW